MNFETWVCIAKIDTPLLLLYKAIYYWIILISIVTFTYRKSSWRCNLYIFLLCLILEWSQLLTSLPLILIILVSSHTWWRSLNPFNGIVSWYPLRLCARLSLWYTLDVKKMKPGWLEQRWQCAWDKASRTSYGTFVKAYEMAVRPAKISCYAISIVPASSHLAQLFRKIQQLTKLPPVQLQLHSWSISVSLLRRKLKGHWQPYVL